MTGIVGDGRVNLYVLLDGTADATVVTPFGPLAGVREEDARYAPAAKHEFGTWHPREA